MVDLPRFGATGRSRAGQHARHQRFLVTASLLAPGRWS